MMQLKRSTLPVWLLSATLAAPVLAQTTMHASAPQPGMMASGAGSSASSAFNGAFLEQAAQNGYAEIQGAKAALDKATDARVKSYAQRLIDDHTKAQQELKTLAAAKGVQLPDEPSMAQKAKATILSWRDGDSYDKHFIESMGIKAHESTIKLFKRAVAEATDPEVKAFASKTLPTLESHLKEARDIHASLGKKK